MVETPGATEGCDGRWKARLSRVPRRLASWGLLAVLAWALAAPAAVAQAGKGAIRGSVRGADQGRPLDEVRVVIAGTQMSTRTASDGTFRFDAVAAGRYVLSFSRAGYTSLLQRDVVVAPGRLAEVDVSLAPEVVEMEELVVTGDDPLGGTEAGLLELRQEAVSLQDAVSAELIAKAGASDVAGALRLVTGATVTEGKYATVRGLSDRYTGTTLNGVRLPSSDARKRAVQVDLFPTATVESVTVTKTFSPDLQGDFTGGGVDIRTKSVPDGLLLEASASTEYDTNATCDSRFLTYDGGGASAFGDGGRGLPAIARDPLPTFPMFSANPTEQQRSDAEAYDRLVRAFRPVIGVDRSAPGPGSGLTLVAGNFFHPGGAATLGVLGALTYKRSYDFYEGGKNNTGIVSGPGQGLALKADRSDSKGTESLLLGGLANIVLRPREGQEYALRWIGNSSARDEARLQVRDAGYPTVERNQSLTYTKRSVTSLQIEGHHDLSRLRIHWTAARNTTSQEEPDVRFFRNLYDFETHSGRMLSNSTDAQNTRRIWRNLKEDGILGSADVIVPFQRPSGREGRLKAGLLVDRTDRRFTEDSFTYYFPNQYGSVFDPRVAENRAKSRFQAEDPEELWTDIFLRSGNVGFAGNEPPAANQLLWTIIPLGDDVDYTGNQEISAAYLMAEVPFGQRLQWMLGARYETTRISIDPSNARFGTVQVIQVLTSGDRAIVDVPEEEAAADIQDGTVLPATSLTWEIVPNMNLRFSLSRTIARPTFRELAPVATEEFLYGDEFIGNPELGLSRINNYDLRWEWFRRSGDVLAVSLFYKELREPIELISYAANNRSFVQPVNFERGTVLGLEAEARSSLDVLWQRLRGLSAGVNYSRILSEVEVPLAERISLTSFGLDREKRPLQGQPAYLANANLTYENDRTGTTAGIFYNRVGETLLTGGARGNEDGTPDVFDEPYTSLDLKVSQEIPGRVTLSLRAANLLRPARRSVYRTPAGDEVVKSERATSARFSVSASWKW